MIEKAKQPKKNNSKYPEQITTLQSIALSRERPREIALCPVCDHLRQTQSRPAAYMSKLSKQCTMYICVYMYTCTYLMIWNKPANRWCICTYINKRKCQNCPGRVCTGVYTYGHICQNCPNFFGKLFCPLPQISWTPPALHIWQRRLTWKISWGALFYLRCEQWAYWRLKHCLWRVPCAAKL